MILFSTKRHWLAVCLGLLVFCTIGLPFTKWWLAGGDDFHCMYLADKTTTWRELLSFFADGNAGKDDGATNFIRTPGTTTFFATYYRPIHMIIYTLLYWLFGINGYAFFLVNVLLHALNTVLLFYLLRLFGSSFTACIGALLFAYHPQIAYRFGLIAFIQYYLSTLCILAMLLMWRRYLRYRNNLVLIALALLFFVTLFVRESVIVLPAILFMSMYLYPPEKTISLKKYFRATLIPLIIVSSMAVVFCLIRLTLYPFELTVPIITPLYINISKLSFSKIQEVLVCMYDCLWLSWLPWGQKLFRLIITIPLISLLFLLFTYNKKKLWILTCLSSALLMLWPGIIGCYSPRYFYEAAPFILLAYTFLVTYYQGPGKKYHKSLQVISIGTIIFLIWFVYAGLKGRELKMYNAQQAITCLLNNPTIKNKPLCFLSYPEDCFGNYQPAEICWVLMQDYSIPIFCDPTVSLIQADANIVTPTKWMNIISKHYDRNYLSIVPVPGGFHYTSQNPNKINFAIPKKYAGSLGKKTVHKTCLINNTSVVTDFTLLIDKQYSNTEPIYIWWDYATKSFKTMPSTP